MTKDMLKSSSVDDVGFWTTTVKTTEPAVTENEAQTTAVTHSTAKNTVSETEATTGEAADTIPPRIIYQTIYNAPETEKTEVSEIEKSEEKETEQRVFSEVTTVPEEWETEEFSGIQTVPSEAAVSEAVQEKILYFTESSVSENTDISSVDSEFEIGIAENTETALIAGNDNFVCK